MNMPVEQVTQFSYKDIITVITMGSNRHNKLVKFLAVHCIIRRTLKGKTCKKGFTEILQGFGSSKTSFMEVKCRS